MEKKLLMSFGSKIDWNTEGIRENWGWPFWLLMKKESVHMRKYISNEKENRYWQRCRTPIQYQPERNQRDKEGRERCCQQKLDFTSWKCSITSFGKRTLMCYNSVCVWACMCACVCVLTKLGAPVLPWPCLVQSLYIAHQWCSSSVPLYQLERKKNKANGGGDKN